MVLITLVDISIRTTVWIVFNVYNGGHWLLYGSPKTREQIQHERIDSLEINEKEDKDEINKLKERISELEKIIISSNDKLNDESNNELNNDLNNN